MKPELASVPLLAAGVLCLCLWLAAPPAPRAAGDPHDFDALGCEACHAGDDPGPGDVRKGVAATCKNCHPACLQGRKHVGGSGSPAAMARPLPLEPPTVMTCHTCHAPHDAATDAAGRKTRYLRLPMDTRALCLNCHGGVRK